MNTNNPYAGTILENTYSPIVFSPTTEIKDGDKKAATSRVVTAAMASAATVTHSLFLSASLVSGIAAGLAVSFHPKEGDSRFHTGENQEGSSFGRKLFDLWEWFVREKALEMKKKEFDSFVEQAHNNYNSYCAKHENYLQKSMCSVDGINRRKVVMKDYLLQELSEQLKRSGLNGSIDEPVIERLDPRDWPINETYNMSVSNDQFIDSSFQQVLSQVYGLGGLWINPVMNRIRIRQIRNALIELQMVVGYNSEQMHSDLIKLDYFSTALANIDSIYKEVLDRLRPIMKDILRDMEDKYQGDVNRMPEDQGDALYTLKTLFKDLTETTIVPRSEDNQNIYTDVCQYSNTLSERYNKIRGTIFNSFCS